MLFVGLEQAKGSEQSSGAQLGVGRLILQARFSVETAPGQQKMNLAYWLAGQKVFKGVQHMGWAADCSRVGGRSVMVQVISGKKNQAMWLVPPAMTLLRSALFRWFGVAPKRV